MKKLYNKTIARSLIFILSVMVLLLAANSCKKGSEVDLTPNPIPNPTQFNCKLNSTSSTQAIIDELTTLAKSQIPVVANNLGTNIKWKTLGTQYRFATSSEVCKAEENESDDKTQTNANLIKWKTGTDGVGNPTRYTEYLIPDPKQHEAVGIDSVAYSNVTERQTLFSPLDGSYFIHKLEWVGYATYITGSKKGQGYNFGVTFVLSQVDKAK